jgi:3-deoxy-D-manno-octulosonic-acid transferase
MVRERLTLGPCALPRTDRRRVLVHCVSVGEVKTSVPLVRALRERFPDREVVLSATTDTGLQVAHEVLPDVPAVRFPVDLSVCCRRFLRRVAPDAIILVELEVWPSFLREANRAGVPVAVVNGRITARSHERYVRLERLFPQFDRISLFCVQSEDYAARFRDLASEPERITLTGNIKADGLRTGRVEPGEELGRLLGGAPGKAVLVGGSTHPPEEELLFRAWREAAPDARLVLVPRHPARTAEIVRGLEAAGASPQLLSELRRGDEKPDPARPALVDSVGELERVYGLADVAYVGGSLLPHGGQNMLEPAAQGLPVLHGPHVENFVREAALLEEAGASLRLAGPGDLAPALGRLLGDPGGRERMGRAGRAAVEAGKGATARTLEALSAGSLGDF